MVRMGLYLEPRFHRNHLLLGLLKERRPALSQDTKETLPLPYSLPTSCFLRSQTIKQPTISWQMKPQVFSEAQACVTPHQMSALWGHLLLLPENSQFFNTVTLNASNMHLMLIFFPFKSIRTKISISKGTLYHLKPEHLNYPIESPLAYQEV